MGRFEELQKKIVDRTAKVGVIGLGYVGLPLAVETIKGGYTVVGIDLHPGKIDSLKAGVSYVQDISNETLQECLATKRFYPTTDYSVIENLDAISICVPTPLSPNQDPDTSYITNVVNQLKKYMKQGMLITLESTTYPGTTEELIQWELEKLGYQAGEDFFLCYSPERVDPGNRNFNTHNTPKIIGGTTPKCIELGTALYGNLVKTVVPVSTPKVAEMSKLLENTFRSVNIAFMNEMALMCDKMGINVWEVIKAASTKPFGYMPFYPGPGIGGHCIPLDPMYLSWKAKGFRFHSQFIDIAQSINDSMPDYVLHKTVQVLNLYAKSINSSKILILGMAYKPDVDDLRESPGLELYEQFKKNGATVDYYDPHAKHFVNKAGQSVHSIDYDLERFRTYDCMVLITNHKSFDYQELADLGVAVIDTRNAFEGVEGSHIYKIGMAVSVPQQKEIVSLLA
ncbi:nucleotide sugar dehydrogenase [Brevibacillus invocatus]|uniref:nucleotide sugar dehydrogenase n=1 Tax=Brevibacillus invocatus TaxID=173959 RepID=UPI002040B70A|nr:nucleotide sugar dehydrogenase [Brevibacillus invocatus]MCM3079422.1 nucleotide sugar dehydrogenase [Brevibacillus invocatus]MCM3429526.1 nucleotide sugar dehydrogenase [Brevibacillus invocatus]